MALTLLDIPQDLQDSVQEVSLRLRMNNREVLVYLLEQGLQADFEREHPEVSACIKAIEPRQLHMNGSEGDVWSKLDIIPGQASWSPEWPELKREFKDPQRLFLSFLPMEEEGEIVLDDLDILEEVELKPQLPMEPEITFLPAIRSGLDSVIDMILFEQPDEESVNEITRDLEMLRKLADLPRQEHRWVQVA